MAQRWHVHLLLQITQVWFLAHTSGALQLPITSVPGATGLRCTHKYPTQQNKTHTFLSWLWWCMSEIPALGKEKQKDQEFKTTLHYVEDLRTARTTRDFVSNKDLPQQNHISGIYSPRHKGRSLHLPLSVPTAGRWHWRTYCWRWHRRTVGKGRGERGRHRGSCHEQYATWLAFNSFCFPAKTQPVQRLRLQRGN